MNSARFESKPKFIIQVQSQGQRAATYGRLQIFGLLMVCRLQEERAASVTQWQHPATSLCEHLDLPSSLWDFVPGHRWRGKAGLQAVKIPRAVPVGGWHLCQGSTALNIIWWERSKGCAKGKPKASLLGAFSEEGAWIHFFSEVWHLIWKFSWWTPDLSFPDQRISLTGSWDSVTALGTAAGGFVCLGKLENFLCAVG